MTDQTGQMHRLISLCWVHRSICLFCLAVAHMSHVRRKPDIGVCDQGTQPQKLARDLKFRIQKIEALYYGQADLHLCWSHMT